MKRIISVTHVNYKKNLTSLARLFPPNKNIATMARLFSPVMETINLIQFKFKNIKIGNTCTYKFY